MKLSRNTRNAKIDAYNTDVERASSRAASGDHEYAAAFYRWASKLAGDLAYDAALPPVEQLAWADRANHCALKWTQHLEAHRS